MTILSIVGSADPAPAGTVTLTPRGENGLGWNSVLEELGWAEVSFDSLEP